MAKQLLTTFILLIATICLNAQEKIRVACVGNSITYGSGIKNRDKDSYPAQLQALLGDEYEVVNFGRGGRTGLSNGDRPYIKEPEYKAVLPGKLFEYMASYRPVLGIGQKDGAMAMILDRTKSGVVLDWEDKAEIATYIDQCWEKHLEGRLTTEDADISQFTRRNLTRRMAQLFDRITRNGQ